MKARTQPTFPAGDGEAAPSVCGITVLRRMARYRRALPERSRNPALCAKAISVGSIDLSRVIAVLVIAAQKSKSDTRIPVFVDVLSLEMAVIIEKEGDREI